MARGLPNLESVASALLEIHQHRLYRNRYRSFQAYLSHRWHFSRARGYQMLHFARLRQLSTTVDSTGPQNERQARRLDAQGQARPKPDDDPIMRAMEYVLGVFEKLPAAEQPELIYHLRDMLTELEQKLKCKARAPAGTAGSSPSPPKPPTPPQPEATNFAESKQLRRSSQ